MNEEAIVSSEAVTLECKKENPPEELRSKAFMLTVVAASILATALAVLIRVIIIDSCRAANALITITFVLPALVLVIKFLQIAGRMRKMAKT